jgi:hypothetical protein
MFALFLRLSPVVCRLPFFLVVSPRHAVPSTNPSTLDLELHRRAPSCMSTYPPIHPPIPRPSIIPPALNYHIIPSPCVAVPHPPARTAALTCQSPIGPSVVDFGLESWAFALAKPRPTPMAGAHGRRPCVAHARREQRTTTTPRPTLLKRAPSPSHPQLRKGESPFIITPTLAHIPHISITAAISRALC